MVLNHREWIRFNFKREHLRFAWDDFFKDWDILLCPQMATPAFPHDHRPFGQRTIDVDGIQRDYFEQLFWSGLVTNAYLPSTVFPTGLSRSGLPIGIQAVSAAYRDRRTIEFARFDGRRTWRISGAHTTIEYAIANLLTPLNLLSHIIGR